ncbi:MAG: ABC transporter substrate-binding protein [Phormidesmis sp.]
MKRRWFLARLAMGGLALPAVSAAVGGCGASSSPPEASSPEAEDVASSAVRGSKTLVVATSANYPPYEKLEAGAEGEQIVGFDIDIARVIAAQLGRELSVVDLAFDELIPALEDEDADMAIAALEPTRSRKQRVDFSDIYYRSQQALISLDGYLDSRDLGYHTIGVRASSVQARFADRLSEDHPDIDVIPYDTLDEVFEALDIGAVEAAILEVNVAKTYLKDYPEFGLTVMQDDRPKGSAIAIPKNSPLRQDINDAILKIKSSGEMSQLIDKWFS